jgi:DNA-binding MltR family transcriptional regulator
MITELLKRLITKKYYKEKADIENKLNVFYAMSKINDEEYSDLTLLVEDTYIEIEETEENTEIATKEEE